MNQYLTTCKDCGKPILMTLTCTGRWVPCSPNLYRFKRAGGSGTYIDENGKLARGVHDRYGEPGYRLHRKECGK